MKYQVHLSHWTLVFNVSGFVIIQQNIASSKTFIGITSTYFGLSQASFLDSNIHMGDLIIACSSSFRSSHAFWTFHIMDTGILSTRRKIYIYTVSNADKIWIETWNLLNIDWKHYLVLSRIYTVMLILHKLFSKIWAMLWYYRNIVCSDFIIYYAIWY